MTNTDPAYAATVQHIQLLAERRHRLERAQLEAEEQFVHAVARELASGAIGLAELERAYVAVQGSALGGFATKRWQQHLPGILQIRAQIGNAIRAEAAALEVWSGPFPIEDHRTMPGAGICVVYVLYDQHFEPCYVGSTGALGTRLAEHVRTGKSWSFWQAHRCRDRRHAYAVETQFLQQYKPYLNAKATC